MTLRTSLGRCRSSSSSIFPFISVGTLVLSGLTMASAFLHCFLATSTTAATAAATTAAAAAKGINKGSTSRMFASAAVVATTNFTPQDVLAKYEELVKGLREIDALEGISGLLGWDEQTMLPSGSAPARAFHKATLAGILHEKKTHSSLHQLLPFLASPEAQALLPCEEARANVRIAHKDWELQNKKTKEMTAKEAELEGKGYAAWVTARKTDDFAGTFLPVLEEIVEMKKEVAGATRPEWGVYDANLDLFEPGMKVGRLRDIFGELKEELVPLLKKIMASPRYLSQDKDMPAALQGGPSWNVDKQAKLSREISEALGFDYSLGRIDTSVHPFTGGSHPTDVRITTRYSEDKWIEGVSATVHEVGHGLYEQGRNPNQRDLPASRALGMGVHESQSLIWERMVFQSRPFWTFATGRFKSYFPHVEGVSEEDFYRFVNRVQPDFIRVEADEVTYPLHIILRFELEQALLDGSLLPSALPGAWNTLMKTLLNVDVAANEGGKEGKGNTKGCLQDVHWAVGALGYFPSYTLGAMMAAQLFAQARREIEGLEGQIEQGQFKGLREWLREKVHVRGSVCESMDELLMSVTGEPLNPAYFVTHLKEKYGDLYQFEEREGGREEL
ncbi:hypothetical protein VYU27_007320 [Nannochloropsis oceanica]